MDGDFNHLARLYTRDCIPLSRATHTLIARD